MFSPPGAVSSWLFGSSVRYFTLSHLWFLWYLLVFATVAPLVAVGAEIVGSRLPRRFPGSNVDTTRTSVAASPAPNSGGVVTDVSVDRSSGNGMAEWLIRWNVIPALVGLISLPCLLLTRPFFGWSLGLAAGIGRAFPDFLWHVELDMPFYFAFFLWGWWLHRKQDLLPSVGARWWSSLTIGLIAFLISWSFSRRFSMQSTLPHYALLRLTGYFCYAVGSAYLSWGFLGLFQRFANAPTRLGRYLADTAFWVYLLHQALLFPFLAWLAPFQLPWWLNGSLSSLMTIMAALLFYECLVRATPLVRLFGPGSAVRPNTLYSS